MTTTSDGLQRTDWFGPEVNPTVPGNYECSITPNGGYVFQRRWNGTDWISSITHEPTKVRMHWRGVMVSSIAVDRYPASLHGMMLNRRLQPTLADIGNPVRDRAAKALYDETMTIP